jgi:hypothetical protein
MFPQVVEAGFDFLWQSRRLALSPLKALDVPLQLTASTEEESGGSFVLGIPCSIAVTALGCQMSASSLLLSVVFFGRCVHEGLCFETRAIQLHDLIKRSEG